MNKKGFTLVEILAVIVILALIIIIVATNGFGAFDKTKEKINEQAKAEIEETSKVLMTDIEHCTDDDEELLSTDKGSLAEYNGIIPLQDGSPITCAQLKEKASIDGIRIPVEYLVDKNYITGNNAKEIIKTNSKIVYNGTFILEDSNDKESPVKDIETICIESCSSFKDEIITIQEPTPLKELIINDKRIRKNEGVPSFTGVEKYEIGMYKAPDDYGESLYFRGKQSYNYVKFAGFTWRIVRINGDGSIRLILNGTLADVKKDGESDFVYKNNNLSSLVLHPEESRKMVEFNPEHSDNAFVGYMYGYVNSDNYDDTHKNVNSSHAKIYLDKFYEIYLNSYSSYLADTLFCGDKTLASQNIGQENTMTGYKTNTTYYAVAERLVYDNGINKKRVATPTLECAKGVENTYSRYTANSATTSKGIEVNNDLNYPIGLLSADELVMAGAFWQKTNNSYYLYHDYNGKATSWWTMTPYNYSFRDYGMHSNIIFSNDKDDEHSIEFDCSRIYTPYIRPVINLKDSTLIVSGNGTEEKPYIVE